MDDAPANDPATVRRVSRDGGNQGATEDTRTRAEGDARGGASLLCPSAPPEMADSVVFGVVGGTYEQPRVAYLKVPQPVTEEVLALARPIAPGEVFRFAAPCATSACRHFHGGRCSLATRVVELLPVAVEGLPPCRIRPSCRWFRQEGIAACFRCPQVVTKIRNPSERLRQVEDRSTDTSSPSRPGDA